MKKAALALLAMVTLAGCGSQTLMPTASQGAASVRASADEKKVPIERQIRDTIEVRYPGLIITSLVVTRDKEAGTALYSFKGVGSYKDQHVKIDGAYVTGRLSACYLRDDQDKLIEL